MYALSLGFGKAESQSVHSQCWDSKQFHRCSNQTGGDHVVHKECTVVRKKHTPKIKKMLLVKMAYSVVLKEPKHFQIFS